MKYALGVTSGTTALYTAMAALEIGPGDEVILPAWTWYADYDAVVLSGGLPVFAEIDESLAMDPKDIEAKITPRTKAIVPQPPPGRPGRHGRDHGDRPQAQAPRGGRLRPVLRRTLQGQVRRHDRRHGHQQLPAQQDDHLGRRRRRGQQRCRSSSSGPCASTTSARSARPTPRSSRAACWRPSPRATSA